MTEEKTKKAPAKKTATKAAATGRVTLVQVASANGRPADQRATLIGLGLNKMHRRSELEDTPSVRGMIAKVQHLVKIVSAA